MTREELARRLLNACAEVKSAEAELTEIDSRFGDADHGLTMHKICTAIENAVRSGAGGVKAMLTEAADAVMGLNGGSAVPLWNSWLDGMAEGAPEADALDIDAIKAVFAAGFEELDDMSGAKVGGLHRRGRGGAFHSRGGGGGAGRGGQRQLCLQIRAREELRRKDHRHAGRGSRVHGEVFYGACKVTAGSCTAHSGQNRDDNL